MVPRRVTLGDVRSKVAGGCGGAKGTACRGTWPSAQSTGWLLAAWWPPAVLMPPSPLHPVFGEEQNAETPGVTAIGAGGTGVAGERVLAMQGGDPERQLGAATDLLPCPGLVGGEVLCTEVARMTVGGTSEAVAGIAT